jgi:hypothetical protein
MACFLIILKPNDGFLASDFGKIIAIDGMVLCQHIQDNKFQH